MNEAMNKLSKISWFVGIIVKILMILIALAIAAVIILAIVAAVNIDLVMENVSSITSSGQVVIMAVCAIAILLFMLLILYYIDHFFKDIREKNTPFTEGSVKDLKILAILTLLFVIAQTVIGAVLVYSIDIPDGIPMTIGFNPVSLFVAGIIYVLYLVFKYGVELQKESDETL